MTKLAIGSQVWAFDPNKSSYSHPRVPFEKVAWREHWRPMWIVGETRVSWVLAYDPKRLIRPFVKVKKAALEDPASRERLYNEYAISDADLDDKCWAHENQYELSQHVLCCQDTDVLRAIAKLVGFEEKKS